jgi:hypothetical protein
VFGAGVALAAAALLAVGFWPVMASRQALRSITLPALLAAAIYWWWRSAFRARGRTWPAALAGGALLGGTFYTYLAARVTWGVVPAMLVYLAARRRDLLRRAWRPTVLVLLVAAAVSVPLFGWLLAHPDAETRIGDLSYPIEQARAGNFEPLLTNAKDALRMFTAHGDTLWMYNIPGRPLLAPVQGVLFVAGLAMAIMGALRGRPGPAFLLIWILAGMAPSLVTGGDASVTRAVGLMPPLYVLAAWALVAFWRKVAMSLAFWEYGPPANPTPGEQRGIRYLLMFWVGIPATLLVALTGLTTYHDYFDRWAQAQNVRVAYHHTLAETVDYLEHSPDSIPVALSSITPEAPHDPAVVLMTLRRGDLLLRWFDARGALLFPDEEVVRVTLPEVTQLDAALAPYFEAAELAARLEMHPEEFNHVVDVYTWRPRDALDAAVPALKPAAGVVVDGDAPPAPTLELLGYDDASPGALVTFWRVLRPFGVKDTDGVKVFVHVLDADGNIVSQDDRLDAPAWTWHPGDVFAQVHRVDLGQASAVYVGAYDRDTFDRLGIQVGGDVGHQVNLLGGGE